MKENIERVWKMLDAAKNDEEGKALEITTAMEVPGGCVVRVETVAPGAMVAGALSLVFVPFVCLVPAPGGLYRFESTMAGAMSSIMETASNVATRRGIR